MEFIPVPNVCQVELVTMYQSQRCQNVFHYSKASPWNVDTMQELAEGVIDWWVANLKPSVTDQMSLIEIGVTDLSSQTAPSIAWTTGLPSQGDVSASPSLPNSISCVFTKRTILRGRSFRGRIYHMGFVESQVIGNALTAAVTSALITAYSAALVIPLVVAVDEALMVVVSRYSNKLPRTEGVATLVTHITSDGVIDSQRRRLPGRGQ